MAKKSKVISGDDVMDAPGTDESLQHEPKQNPVPRGATIITLTEIGQALEEKLKELQGFDKENRCGPPGGKLIRYNPATKEATIYKD